jgi:3-deoxy-manno-octulosonate cytidylyltransferase (CMP-KDO synthetase)
MSHDTVIIIPARYKSSRYPGKPLVLILGKPLILHVAELCARALPLEAVYVATEDERIKETVESAGFNVVMTTDKPLTGTDRLAEAMEQIDANIYINVQGDEPLVNPEDILKIVAVKKHFPDCVIKGYTEIDPHEDPHSLNIPKVIFTEDERMIYVSRQLLPGSKESSKVPACFYKAVCIYAFGRNDLRDYAAFGRKSLLEQYEDIEILRYLDIGTTVRMVKTSGGSYAVDVPEDVAKVEAEMRCRGMKARSEQL